MRFIAYLLLFSFIFPVFSYAQEVHQDIQGVWRAKVLEVINEREEEIPGTGTIATIQTLEVEILEGEKKGINITIENDFFPLKEKQNFYMNYLITISGDEIYSVRDLDRRGSILWLVILFAAVVLIFGRWQGFRSLMSLVGSLLVIIYVLLPLLIQGYNPVLISILIGALILFVAIFFTHGFNIRSLVAFIGTVISIVITGVLAFVSIDALNLTGFFSDETVYLNLGTQGILDFKGLLLGGMIIGVLGVLDDIAITQTAVVSEIKNTDPNISDMDLYKKAINVGREHVGALVNTIVLAYAGVALPLLLWFSRSEATFGKIINNEIFATEIARTIVGSIGLILTVPITTFLAVMMVNKYKDIKGGHHHHHH